MFMESGKLKGNFPMYVSMKYQNFNPDDNLIVPNNKFFISGKWGETAISSLYMNSKKGTAVSPLLLKLCSSTFHSGLLCSSTTKKNGVFKPFFYSKCASILKSLQSM